MKYIFGHSPSTDSSAFASVEKAPNYLSNVLSDQQTFRYRTTYSLADVESTIFSFDGELLAELVVGKAESPTAQDRTEYSQTRKVYLIDEIRIFRKTTLKAADLNMTTSQFGTKVSSDVCAQMIDKVGGFEQTIRKQ